MSLDFRISFDRTEWNTQVIRDYLADVSYWWTDRAKSRLEKSWDHSLCIAALAGNDTVGFARVVTDYVTIAYLCDVFVLDTHRGHGIGKRLVERALTHPELETCGWRLGTRDAHALYEQFGFTRADADVEGIARQMVRKPMAKHIF